MNRRLKLLWLSPLVLLLAATVARAQSADAKLPLAADGSIERLVRVTAHTANCAAVSDAHGWLAIGNHPAVDGAHVSLFRLDANGKLAPGDPIPLKLPSPAGLAEFANYPLSLVFHPTLPLLYVWQDVTKPKRPVDAAEEPARLEFDHLHIYSLAGPQPELVRSQARGHEFATGIAAGTIALDAANARLYVPNVRQRGLKARLGYATSGFLGLDAAGLPLLAETSAAADSSRAGANTVLEYMMPKNTTASLGFPYGMGFVPVSKDIVIAGMSMGALVWDGANRRGWGDVVMLHPMYRGGYNDRIAGHPTLPVVYSSVFNHNWLCTMQHAEGYLTLMPKRLVVEGALFKSYPVVLTARKRLAVGGAKRLYLFELDDQGFPTPNGQQLTVLSHALAAIAYSEKFDTLYVAQEKQEKSK